MNSAVVTPRRIPNSVEIIVVMALAFWWFIYESMRWFFLELNEYGWTSWEWESGWVMGTRVGIYAEPVAVLEIVLVLLLFTFMKRRGWSWTELKAHVNFRSAWHAIVLFLTLFVIHLMFFKVCTLIYSGLQFRVGSLFEEIYPDTWSCIQNWQSISYYSWLPAIVIDAFYWEFFLLFYLFKRLDNVSPLAVMGLSAAVRLSCHIHTGPYGWISILLVSAAMGLYYWKFKNLTVPIAVHALWNFTLFSFYTI